MLKPLLNPAIPRRIRVIKNAENLHSKFVRTTNHHNMKVPIRNLMTSTPGARMIIGASVILGARVSRVGGNVLGASIVIGIGSGAGIIPATVTMIKIAIAAVIATAPLTMIAISQNLAMTAAVIIPQAPLTVGQTGSGSGIDIFEHQC